ncbi:hypothetical protein IWX78_001380 [Mycetocola sp. CAN_C7]|uniref:hypothetical protein n=1 Tax=Mycetocola sp. CAN_C7 TaxID=2787724 RepID=UPI0018CAB364
MTNPPQSPYGPADPSGQNPTGQNPPPYSGQQQPYNAAQYYPQEQPPYGYTVVGPTGPKRSNGPGLAALIIGVVAVVIAFIPFIGFFAFLLGPAGIIVGIVGLVLADRPRRQAAWGTGLSAASMVIAFIMIFVYTFGLIFAVGGAVDGATRDLPTIEPSPFVSPSPTEAAADPLPLGTVVELTDIGGQADYEATITTSVLDATDLVAAANASNTDAPAGFQWAMITVDLTSLSDDGVTPRTNILINFVTADGERYSSLTPFAIAPDPRFELIDGLAAGDSATGNVVVAIPSDAVDGGTWELSHADAVYQEDRFTFETE